MGGLPVGFDASPGERAAMVHIGFEDIRDAVLAARRQARHAGHIHRARQMLAAAGIASAAIVMVAGALLAQAV